MGITTERDLADAIRGATGPLSVQGGGTRGMSAPGEVLDVSGLSGITLYEPGALTLVAQAGTPIAEIETALAQENQRLAFEPMDHRALMLRNGEPTIGGVVAANVSGPRRISVGAARDFTLGVRFVDGTGTVIKNGGRVMKNVTGYDLVKLMSGSCGTLGVLTEVALKVLPMPETESTLILRGLDDDATVRAMACALSSPFDVSGAAHLGEGRDARTLLRLEGFEGSVAYRAGALKDLMGDLGAEMEIVSTESPDLWQAVRDVTEFAGSDADIWKVSCKPSDGRLWSRNRALWVGSLIGPAG